MNEQNEKPLLILENCPPVDYVIIGFTQTDIAMIALWTVIGVIVGISVYAYNGNSIIAVVIVLVTAMLAISIFRRNQYTENLIDQIKVIFRYWREQKQYEYEYINIWELERKKGYAEKRKKTQH